MTTSVNGGILKLIASPAAQKAELPHDKAFIAALNILRYDFHAAPRDRAWLTTTLNSIVDAFAPLYGRHNVMEYTENYTADLFTDLAESDAPVFKGYSQKELDEAFQLVQNPSDWKVPINTWVRCGNRADGLDIPQLAVIAAAVEFFTGGKAKFGCDVSGADVKVTAIGYRAGPAGDH